MNTYTWEVESLDCLPDGNVVSCVHWRLKANDGTNISEVYGMQNIEKNTKNVFIDYEKLSKDDVIGWAKESMGTDAIADLQKTLDKKLQNLANPPIISPPLPWNK